MAEQAQGVPVPHPPPALLPVKQQAPQQQEHLAPPA